jgi:asparagine synthase (glutamine-hydrolysing)
MCGIAGVMHFERGRPVEPALLQAMADRIAHRGPDAEGFWTGPGVGLAHRRLSIIDLAAGQQPLGNEDGSIQVVFNGEIYNYLELRNKLLARGHVFRTHSDTEVLVHLYEEAGDALVEQLRGMFAFALWDGRRERLLLARDRLGIKPLYVYRDAGKVLFGSEIKALLGFPDVRRDLDPCALEDYLAYGMVPGPRSIFRGIEKLQPAHTLAVERAGNATQTRYWRLTLQPDPKPSVEEWQERIRDKLAETVKAHLIADVPVGAFLSGGVDSGAVTALARAAGSAPLQTFSIGFHEKEFSELEYARQVAGRYGTRHTEEVVTPDAVSLLDDLTLYYDEPFADPSALPTFLVSRLAARSVKVVLSGDGGDEAFGGYARYAHDLREAAIRRRLPGWLRRGVLGPLARLWPKADWLPRPLRLKTALTNLSLEEGAAYANTLTLCRQPLRRRLLSGDVCRELNGHDPGALVRGAHAGAAGVEPLDGMLGADVATLLPDDFLVKVDRASMACGLEVRPSLLDHELLELAARVPAAWKVHHGETKWIFKKAVENLLPPETVWRRKQGFELPVDAWLRGPLREMFESAVLRPGGAAAGLLERRVVEPLYRSHLAGVGRHGSVLWSLLVLARWADRYLVRSS